MGTWIRWGNLGNRHGLVGNTQSKRVHSAPNRIANSSDGRSLGISEPVFTGSQEPFQASMGWEKHRCQSVPYSHKEMKGIWDLTVITIQTFSSMKQ